MSSAANAPRSDDARIRVFGSLCGLVFLVNFGRVTFAPLIGADVFTTAFDASAATAGFIATAAWLGSAAPRLPAGYLLTRFPRERVVLGTGLFLALAAFLMAQANSVNTVLVGAFLVGIASGVYFIAANPLVSELFPDRVGRVLGIHGTASQLAAVVAPLLVVAVLAQASWRLVFYGLGTAAIVSALAFFHTSKRAEMPQAGAADRHLLRAARNQWPIVLTGVVIMGLTGFVWQGVFNFYVKYLTATKGVDGATAQTLLTVVFAAGVPAFWYAGKLADRLPTLRLLLTILGAFAVCLFSLTLSSGFLPIVAVSVATGFVIHSLFPTMDTFLLGSLPDEDRGSAYAVYSGSMMVMQANGSAAVGWFVDAGFAYNTIFQTLAGGLAVLVTLLYVAYRLGWLPHAAR
ncbi:MFS transporter [Halospeciosus flavus]|uniref:MFS transporter n=1 Tax=Halospeciosus flavus TaxID=3032283 RepID=A0ABD5Z6E6_9EURY|nr:MFS transporter [Halospeciosus flavus]